MQYQQNQPPAYTVSQGVPVVIPVQTTVIHQPLGPSPTLIVCPSCQTQIITRALRSPSVRTHIIAALLCIFGLWPCACLPYCIDTCNNTDHYCPQCNSYVGGQRF